MRAPHVFLKPVHQMDVAPLLADLAGLRAPSSWLGRNPLLDGEGTPWVKYVGPKLFYRTSKRICGKVTLAKPLECWAASEASDPLLEQPQTAIPEDPKESETFSKVLSANEAALEFDKVVEPTQLSRPQRFQ